MTNFENVDTVVSACFLNQSLKVVIVWQRNSGLGALDQDSLCFKLLYFFCLSRQRLLAAAGSLLSNMQPNTNKLSTVIAVELGKSFAVQIEIWIQSLTNKIISMSHIVTLNWMLSYNSRVNNWHAKNYSKLHSLKPYLDWHFRANKELKTKY